VVFLTGLAGAMGYVPLPAGLQVLQQTPVLIAAGALLLVEFVADKVPGLDSLWDGLHTLLRIPAGAALAAGVFGGDSASWATVAALMGGTLAATSHVAKATTRAAVNTSPEPFSNIALSLAGDALVPGMLWLAVQQPLWFALVLLVFLVVSVVLTIVLFKFLRTLVRGLRNRLAGAPAAP
jgi:hypothetical protein